MKKRGFEYFESFAEDISLVLDSYEDLFSDFDPRPYSQKALSGDFLLECKRASVDKKDHIQLRFFLPKSKREPLDEIKIKKRLKEHFHKHLMEKKKEIFELKMKGSFWAALGLLMMILSAFFFTNHISFIQTLLTILLQPAGWFFFWEGLAKILITPKETMPDYLFYKKMVNAKVSFSNYKP